MFKLLIALVLGFVGCDHDAVHQIDQPRGATAAPFEDLIAPGEPRFGFERVKLVGAEVEAVARAYGVAVQAEGWSDLVGERFPQGRTPPGVSLGVEAAGGKVVNAVLTVPLLQHTDEQDFVAAVERRLGKPSETGCWWECAWASAGVALHVQRTRTTNWIVLALR